MIDYVDYYNENNALADNFGEGHLMISAEEQCWDDETLKQLKKEYDIIFMSAGDGVIPVKVITYGNNNYGVVLGSEDDGTICFEKYFGSYKGSFSEYWIDYLIADLQEAKRYINQLKENKEVK